jgi:hypothetical protein
MKPVRILLLCLALLPRPAAASDFKPTDLAALGAAGRASAAFHASSSHRKTGVMK